MEVVAERYEDPDLKALADAGEDVSWAGEVIRFLEAGTEYRFDLDDSMPGEAVFSRITEGGRESGVKLTRPQGPAFRQLPRCSARRSCGFRSRAGCSGSRSTTGRLGSTAGSPRQT
jgi:hypothetical protein